MDQPIDTSQTVNAIRYELAITAEEARLGTKKYCQGMASPLGISLSLSAEHRC